MTLTPAEHRTADVEVKLHELLDWSHDYEHFVDLLREKLPLDLDKVLLQDDSFAVTEFEACLIQEFSLTGVSRPNCVIFTVDYIIED